MNPHVNSIMTSLSTYLLLALACVFPVAMVMLDVLWVGNNIGEHSFTEYSQSFVVILIIVTFSYITAKHQEQRAFEYMAIGLFIAMLVVVQNFDFYNIAHLV